MTLNNEEEAEDEQSVTFSLYGKTTIARFNAAVKGAMLPEDKALNRSARMRAWVMAWVDRQPINIIFDGPPGHESGRFVEVETDSGKGLGVGEWIDRKDGTWALRITNLPVKKYDE